MDKNTAVQLLIDRFPILKKRVDDENDLFETPHVSFGLLASEVLNRQADSVFVGSTAQFINELAESGDELLEELLVIDVLEGIAQDPHLAERIRRMVSPVASEMLSRVEREFFGRSVNSGSESRSQ